MVVVEVVVVRRVDRWQGGVRGRGRGGRRRRRGRVLVMVWRGIEGRARARRKSGGSRRMVVGRDALVLFFGVSRVWTSRHGLERGTSARLIGAEGRGALEVAGDFEDRLRMGLG